MEPAAKIGRGRSRLRPFPSCVQKTVFPHGITGIALPFYTGEKGGKTVQTVVPLLATEFLFYCDWRCVALPEAIF
jgi:hypothetical protein